MIFSITNPTELVDWLQIFCKSGWLSPWDPPLQWRKNPRKKLPPRNTPDSFCRLFHPTKSFACTAWAVFFFSGEDCTVKISCADRTWYRLSVNAAAQTGAGTAFGVNGDPHTWAAQSLLIFASYQFGNNFRKGVLSAAVEGKNRPVATNFQFLKISCSSGTSLLKLLRVFQVILLG